MPGLASVRGLTGVGGARAVTAGSLRTGCHTTSFYGRYDATEEVFYLAFRQIQHGEESAAGGPSEVAVTAQWGQYSVPTLADGRYNTLVRLTAASKTSLPFDLTIDSVEFPFDVADPLTLELGPFAIPTALRAGVKAAAVPRDLSDRLKLRLRRLVG